ncbi:MAG: acetyl-CoA carboxylase biotin carboxyl carrier protein [Phycisphaerales bacterium]
MIDIRKLKELVRLMVENDLSELDLKDQQETVTIKRGSGVVMAPPMVHHVPVAPPGASAAAASGEPPEAGASGPGDESGLVAITSPMVGTFYCSPNPDSPAFVSVGTSVGPDSTVCLIEAMKVFNEIKAEVGGIVERVLIENGKPVEYGQRLFLVRPN